MCEICTLSNEAVRKVPSRVTHDVSVGTLMVVAHDNTTKRDQKLIQQCYIYNYRLISQPQRWHPSLLNNSNGGHE
eukprot:COSAG01_NODE_614_length_14830_cov_87.820572_5_plen_75_part_00